MAKDINHAVREVCLWFPETEEVLAHGSPDFRVRGKTFATFVVNYHGDGCIALWLNAPTGAQALYTKEEPKPPYMGHNGWIALDVTKDCNWDEVRSLALFSYRHFALQRMLKALGDEK